MTRNQLIIIGIGIFFVLIFFLMLVGVIPGFRKQEPTAVQATLTMWGVGRDNGQFDGALAEFKNSYPNISVKYRGFDSLDTYESALLEAFASGKSPDIFMVANESFPRFANKIIPFSTTAMPLSQLEQLFPQTVEETFVQNGQVYALPLSIDTLALIYNKDMLSAAGIPVPPATWDDFKAEVPNLVKKDKKTGDITVAASTIGGSEANTKNAADLLSALMIQTGTKMVSSDFSNATFSSEEGRNALAFYTQFANPDTNSYTWNASMPYSIDAFSQEKVAMTFGYLSDVNDIKSKNSFLNFGVAPLPQPSSAVKASTHPFYYGLAVSIQTKQNDAAKRLILGITTNPVAAASYLDATKQPPALLSLVDRNVNDPIMNVFSKQILFARSWPKPDDRAVTQIFSRMIDNVVSKKLSVYDSLQQGASEVNTVFQQKSL